MSDRERRPLPGARDVTATLTVTIDFSGTGEDAALLNGESVARAIALKVGEIAGETYTAQMAIGAIYMLANVVAVSSRDLAADYLTDLGASYRRAAEADAVRTRH